jgi:hypothetical protein
MDYEKEMNTVKKLVLVTLESHERARNDDEYLIDLIKIIDGSIKSESIVRLRRRIQNTEGLCLPTRSGVLARRRFKQEQVQRYFGANSKEYKNYLEYRFGFGVVRVEMP